MGLKTSHYSFFFDADDGYILAYNAFSNSFARITREKYKTIKEILKNPDRFSFNTDEKNKLKDDLKKGSFIIDDALDEVEILKMKNKIGRFATDYLALTIAPTLRCQFFCSYCFEDRKKDTMSKEVEEAVTKFVKKRINNINSLYVSWFGGEPTLRLDIIERLVTGFQKLCKENKIVFHPMSIITNGYLLSRDNAKKLKDLNITRAQVTIDGPQEVHDLRRKLKDGSGTFYKIIKNIRESMDILNIYIRVNIDRENVGSVEKLYEVFKDNGFLDRIPFYFGQVQSNTKICSDISTICFNTKEHSSVVVELLKKSKEKGFQNFSYPSPQHFGFCIADKLNGFVIAPSGYIFKCWCEISSDEKDSVGTVFEKKPSPYQINNMTCYMNWEPFDNKQCIKCKFLPICAGGCPFNVLKSNHKDNCTNFKYNLQEMLRLKYAELKAAK